MTRAERIAKWTKVVQQDIVSCPNEQSWEDGEIAAWILGCPSDIPDLLYSNGVPEELHAAVADNLHCPHCGTPLEPWQDVGTAYPYEKQHESYVKAALSKFGRNLFEFQSYLLKHPLLGASHPVGRRILREMRNLPRTKLGPSVWFRARETKDHGFGPTHRPLVGDQRYNSSGQPRWYFSSTVKTAVAEAGRKGAAWVQQFKLNGLNDVLDLRSWAADDDRAMNGEGEYNPPQGLLGVALIFTDLLVQRADVVSAESRWKPEYLLPRFVADAAEADGFAGILCGSVRFPGTNLVVFDPNWDAKPEGAPQHLTLDPEDLEIRNNLYWVDGTLHQIVPLNPIDIL